MAPIDPVPVLMAPDLQTALAWATAENEARRSLHPADEVRQYAQMSANHLPADVIARSCGVTLTHVQRRLKLAALPDAALNALRRDEITLDTAKALTYASDKDACLQALDAVQNKNIHPSRLRHELTEGRVKTGDRRVNFVGYDAYIDAGGTAEPDLFEGGGWLTDPVLLQTLFDTKLNDAAAQELETGGWKWVKAIGHTHLPWADHEGMELIMRTPIDLPDADQRELEDLSTKGESEELTDEEADRIEELELRAEGDWTEEDRARSGAFVLVNHAGDIRIEAAWVKPDADQDAVNSDDAGTPISDDDDRVEKIAAEPPKPAFPQNLLDDLQRIRLHGLQRPLAAKPDLALDLLAFSLLDTTSPFRRPLSITADRVSNIPERDDGFTADKRLNPEPVNPDYRQDAVKAFAEFQAMGKRHRNEVLTHALARQLLTSADREPLLAVLAETLQPNLRKTWSPTAAFFKRIQSIGYLQDLYFDLTGIDPDSGDGKAMLKLNKGEMAKALDGLFNDLSVRETIGLSRDQNAAIDTWLPAQLQFGGDVQ